MELAPDGRQRGGDDGLVERGQEHRQHQAEDDGPDLVLRQRDRRRKGRSVTDADDLARKAGQFLGEVVGQCLDVGRLAALPCELVHFGRVRSSLLRRKAAKDSFYEANLDSKVLLRQAPRRMGASRTAVIPNN